MPESGFGVSLSNQYAALEEDAPSTEVKGKDGKTDAAAVRKKVDKKEKTKAKAAARSGKPSGSTAAAPAKVNPKKKEHDRHSGVSKSVKKDGAGAHSWGKETELLEADYAKQQEEEEAHTPTTAGPTTDSGDSKGEKSGEPAGDEKPTLAEFRMKQQASRPKGDDKKPRPPRVDGKFRAVAEKKDEEDEQEGKKEKKSGKKKPKAKPAKLNIAQFNEKYERAPEQRPRRTRDFGGWDNQPAQQPQQQQQPQQPEAQAVTPGDQTQEAGHQAEFNPDTDQTGRGGGGANTGAGGGERGRGRGRGGRGRGRGGDRGRGRGRGRGGFGDGGGYRGGYEGRGRGRGRGRGGGRGRGRGGPRGGGRGRYNQGESFGDKDEAFPKLG